MHWLEVVAWRQLWFYMLRVHLGTEVHQGTFLEYFIDELISAQLYQMERRDTSTYQPLNGGRQHTLA